MRYRQDVASPEEACWLVRGSVKATQGYVPTTRLLIGTAIYTTDSEAGCLYQRVDIRTLTVRAPRKEQTINNNYIPRQYNYKVLWLLLHSSRSSIHQYQQPLQSGGWTYQQLWFTDFVSFAKRMQTLRTRSTRLGSPSNSQNRLRGYKGSF